MSGGRATVSKGKVRQAGDICAVAPEGHRLTDYWFIECKHVKSLDLGQFTYNGAGMLGKFWTKARAEARKYKKHPMIIAQQNRWTDPIVVTEPKALGYEQRPIITIRTKQVRCDVYLFSQWMAAHQ